MKEMERAHMVDSYRSALDYLYGYTNYEVQSGYDYSPDRFDLGRVHRLLEHLGDPHRSFRSVHVAGTKGKGSTSAMIASVLRQEGYRTGLYSSPHLHTFRERIQLDGELIPERDVIDGVRRLMDAACQTPGITTFELITALAFDYFARQGTEWAVLEVGMGGRLDATNVVRPQVSVITSISYDHMMYLGDTLPAIAAEKAGIIKAGVPVVSAPQPAEVAAVISSVARDNDAPLVLVGRDWLWESTRASSESQQFTVWRSEAPHIRASYTLPLLGSHQLANAVTAIAAVEVLRTQSTAVRESSVSAGLANVRWPGRLEVLSRSPWVIVDGAHNGDSMHKLIATLADLFRYDRLITILGVSADKDIERMLDAVLPAADHILVTKANHPRAADPEQLARRIRDRGGRADAVPVENVLQRALSLAGPADLVCGTGSLFLVAALRAACFALSGQPLPPSDDE